MIKEQQGENVMNGFHPQFPVPLCHGGSGGRVAMNEAEPWKRGGHALLKKEKTFLRFILTSC